MTVTFINEAWFWTGAFTAIGSLGVVLIRELLASKAQIKIERVRLYERECLDAYKKLYGFVSSLANVLCPPRDPQQDFIEYMSHMYADDVKPNKLLFPKEIRVLCEELETHYDCLREPEFTAPIPFDEFISIRANRLMEALSKEIERQTDQILHK